MTDRHSLIFEHSEHFKYKIFSITRFKKVFGATLCSKNYLTGESKTYSKPRSPGLENSSWFLIASDTGFSESINIIIFF